MDCNTYTATEQILQTPTPQQDSAELRLPVPFNLSTSKSKSSCWHGSNLNYIDMKNPNFSALPIVPRSYNLVQLRATQ